MTHLPSRFLTCLCAAFTMGCAATSTTMQKPVDDGNPMAPPATAWRELTVSGDNIYIALPSGFSKEPVPQAAPAGASRAWFFLEGENESNWTQRIRVHSDPGVPPSVNSPKVGLETFQAGLKKICPTAAFEDMTQQDPKRAGAIAGCRVLPNTNESMFGAYLIIEGRESMYTVAHETHLPALAADALLPTPLALWQTQIDSTILCEQNRGSACAIKAPANTIRSKLQLSIVPSAPAATADAASAPANTPAAGKKE